MTQDVLVISDEKHSREPIEDTIIPGSITDNADGSKTLYLKYPITVVYKKDNADDRKEVINSMTFRRPNGGDIKAVHTIKDGLGQTLVIFERLSGQPRALFDRMDGEDIQTMSELIESFLPQSPRTGKS